MKRAVLRVIACAFVIACALALSGCVSHPSSDASSVQSETASSSGSAVSEDTASDDTASQAADVAEGIGSESASAAATQLAPGEYTVDVDTHNAMFRVNEADEGKGVLTVDDEGMTVHIRLVSKKIVNLYLGTAEQAAADSAGVLEPTTDKVTYSDGYEEEVYGFDVPVPALDEAFDVAVLGEKGKWYDHQVIVSNPVAK